MKLSRRCFLSFVIGGAAGTAASPLPWKLTDDLSIWSQNWPWTPVPPDGESSYVNSTCTLCPGHCAIRVRKVDQRAVKIEGREKTPLNPDGGLCLLGMSGLQLLYGPTRVPGPLKRVGDRGQGQWQAISWQAAIDEVVARLAELRSVGKPQALACLVPTQSGTLPQLFKRLLTAFGSPNFLCMPSSEDAGQAVLSLTRGIDGFVGLDVENADYILSFGSSLMDGFGVPPRMMQAVGRLQANHGQLVQIEPRLSNTAAKADLWLAAKPGTEADLALSMAHVIIAQNNYRADFVASSIDGFDDFAKLVRENYAPETVAATTGIEAATIVVTALAFAGAQRPLAIFGRGKGQTPGSLKEALAVYALNALVGNINGRGGAQAIPAYDYLNWPEAAVDAVATTGLQTRRIDNAGSKQHPHARHLVHRFIDAVHAAPDQVQMLMVAEANPCYSLPDSAKVTQALAKIPFIVSFSSFMDETAMQADLILPNHVYLERFEDLPVLAGTARPYIGLCRPVVAPVFDTRHAGDVVLQIAKALNGTVAKAFPWANYESCLRDTMGDQWLGMLDKGFWVADDPVVAGFQNPTGKLVLMNATLDAILRSAPPIVEDQSGAPLLIAYDSIRLASGYVGATPFMVKVLSDTTLKGQDGFVDLNPETAGKLDLVDGQMVLVTTSLGQAKVRVHLDHGVMPGVLAMPRGLGHTAYDEFLAGKGVNINQLIGAVQDPASGLDAAIGIQAKVTKA